MSNALDVMVLCEFISNQFKIENKMHILFDFSFSSE